MVTLVRASLVATVLASLALTIAPTIARANPRIGLSWNQCDSVETVHPVVSADRVAHLFVFIEGLVGEVTGFEVEIQIRSTGGNACTCYYEHWGVPPAWNFEPGGCQGPDRLNAEFRPPGSGCPTLANQPSFASQTAVVYPGYCSYMTCPTSYEALSLQAGATHPWSLATPIRTTLWRLDFDLSASCAFAPSGVTCCPDDSPLSLQATGGLAWLKDGSTVQLDGSRVTYSSDAVPARSASWGQIKAIYR